MIDNRHWNMSIGEAIERRRSVRAFKSDGLDKATVMTLLQAAVLAPTARHFEPWAFVVVQNRLTMKRISDVAMARWPPADHDRHALAHMPPGHPLPAPPSSSIFYDAGTLIVICSKPVGPFAAADCWLAAENLMLAATAMGLGTCCIGSAVEALNAPDVKAELAIPAETNAVVPIIVGVPEHVPAAPGRKDPVLLSWA